MLNGWSMINNAPRLEPKAHWPLIDASLSPGIPLDAQAVNQVWSWDRDWLTFQHSIGDRCVWLWRMPRYTHPPGELVLEDDLSPTWQCFHPCRCACRRRHFLLYGTVQSAYRACRSLPPKNIFCNFYGEVNWTQTLISYGGSQFAHLSEALWIKSMNLRDVEGASIVTKAEGTTNSNPGAEVHTRGTAHEAIFWHWVAPNLVHHSP